ncbi:MAG: nickel pincer cofactor biosynthesis protein LarC [Deltaproteobacteria bacterium]|nr:nickel pincer cofactor biosynthesis protein LarC [Deltaproteobacteria bacterium]
MKKILYIDCIAGISGDMFMAALIDLGADLKKIKLELKKIPLTNYTISTSKERRHAIEGTRFKVKTTEEKHHRTFSNISTLINNSKLTKSVKKLSTKIFKNLAIAEGKVHGIPAEEVHFHEVGAVDSIVDIVGSAIALESLNFDEIFSSPVQTGSGLVKTMHGIMPIPAPATLEILKGIKIEATEVKKELTTPTGAVILKTIAKSYGSIPNMIVENIGYGIGGWKLKELPNVLRLIQGKEEKKNSNKILSIETNIDDMTPELAGNLMERLFEEGALDVFFTSIQMKKSRPGLLLTVLLKVEDKEHISEIIFKESTSIGLRFSSHERECLERESKKIKTSFGIVRIKVSKLNGKTVNITPEYDDIKKISKAKKIPMKEIFNTVMSLVRKESFNF